MHRSLLASPFAVALVLALTPTAAAEPPQLHVETDPLPLIQGGYGLQAGVRPAGTPWRIAVASFSLDVPDPAVQIGGNDGFHLRVRPSAAIYVLRYFPGRSGWLVGGIFGGATLIIGLWNACRLDRRRDATADSSLSALGSAAKPDHGAAPPYQWR
mgnify:CR=1 FL=1